MMKSTTLSSQRRHAHPHPAARSGRVTGSVLSWPAWKRIAVVLPLCLLLWLGVAWALAENLA